MRFISCFQSFLRFSSLNEWQTCLLWSLCHRSWWVSLVNHHSRSTGADTVSLTVHICCMAQVCTCFQPCPDVWKLLDWSQWLPPSETRSGNNSRHTCLHRTQQFARSRAVARAQWNLSECQLFTVFFLTYYFLLIFFSKKYYFWFLFLFFNFFQLFFFYHFKPFYLFTFLPFYLFTSLPFYLFYLFTSLPLYLLPFYLFTFLPFYLYICPFLNLFIFVYLFFNFVNFFENFVKFLKLLQTFSKTFLWTFEKLC